MSQSKELVLSVMRAQGKADALDLRSRAKDMDGTAIIAEREKAPNWQADKDYSSWPAGAPVRDEERTYGEYTVEFSHGNIRVKSAPCANQDCVRIGWIRRGGRCIVCLPGRFVVELSAESGENDDFDIVVK